MKRAAPLLAVGLLLLPGCRSLRAEVGVGAGFGVELSLPVVLHTGLSLGGFTYVGHRYDRGWGAHRKDGDFDHSGRALFFCSMSHDGAILPPDLAIWKAAEFHTCGGVAPLLWDVLREKDPRESYALEIGVHLLFVSLRLGWNPWYLFD
ncbi:MAG: hypothetical protein D6731_19220 [Planctomycetota bacterium]|nr:MAG: hypothetical protein D6731_19220 [Planctomycetota bacterium]